VIGLYGVEEVRGVVRGAVERVVREGKQLLNR
jgi:hypothetical protein